MTELLLGAYSASGAVLQLADQSLLQLAEPALVIAATTAQNHRSQ